MQSAPGGHIHPLGAAQAAPQLSRGPLEAHWLGRVPYREALTLQERVHAEVAQGVRPDTLLLLEHDAVITTGRQVVPGNVLIGAERRQELGIDLVETGRGGDVTYHGPGQLVGYPIVALQAPDERDIRGYVHRLEEVLIRTASDFGVVASRIEGLRGIWVGNDKLAAIGIRLVKWVTLHGFAFNVSTDLRDFQHIVPCGLTGRGVTSLDQLCAQPPSLQEVRRRLAYHSGVVLGRALHVEQVHPL